MLPFEVFSCRPTVIPSDLVLWRDLCLCRSPGLGLNDMKKIGEALCFISKRGPEVCLKKDNQSSVWSKLNLHIES